MDLWWLVRVGTMQMDLLINLTKEVPNSTPLEIILSQDKCPTKLWEKAKLILIWLYIQGRQWGLHQAAEVSKCWIMSILNHLINIQTNNLHQFTTILLWTPIFALTLIQIYMTEFRAGSSCRRSSSSTLKFDLPKFDLILFYHQR